VVNIHALIAEILGVDATIAEDGTGWLTFLRWLTTRGHSGVRLMLTPGC
jgi:putative transposase